MDLRGRWANWIRWNQRPLANAAPYYLQPITGLPSRVEEIMMGLLRFSGQVDYAASLLVAAIRSYSTGLT
ncbi:MAG: hypothetical protein EOO70_00575 [Myxococcaceae bacterium]|nr:MAG: hypothetical protein EOO70_00575 [Myxococcaceae bacterium]